MFIFFVLIFYKIKSISTFYNCLIFKLFICLDLFLNLFSFFRLFFIQLFITFCLLLHRTDSNQFLTFFSFSFLSHSCIVYYFSLLFLHFSISFIIYRSHYFLYLTAVFTAYPTIFKLVFLRSSLFFLSSLNAIVAALISGQVMFTTSKRIVPRNNSLVSSSRWRHIVNLISGPGSIDLNSVEIELAIIEQY